MLLLKKKRGKKRAGRNIRDDFPSVREMKYIIKNIYRYKNCEAKNLRDDRLQG